MPSQNETVHILLVDDDEVDVRAVSRALKKCKIGNPMMVARDGSEALDILRGTNGHQRLPRPYLVLLDLNMPRMNGIEFLSELRNDPDLRRSIVFVLTTSNSEQDQLAAYDKSIAGYLVKSEVGKDFLKLVQLLDPFVITVQFPPE